MCSHRHPGAFGLAYTADALGLSALQQVYSISDVESGGMVSAIGVGLLVMAPIAGLLSDSVGRKKIILVGLLVSFLSCFFKPFVPSFQWQITLRIFQGAAAACVWIPAPVMIAEMMPKSVRGPLTILYSVGWPIFAGFSALFGYFLLPSGKNATVAIGAEEGWWMAGWQWYFFISSLPLGIVLVLVYYFIAESPRFHASVGHHLTAKTLVDDMYAMNGKKSPDVFTVVAWKNNAASARKTLAAATPWSKLCCTSGTLVLYAIWICKAGGSWGANFWMPTYVERRIKLDALNEIKRTTGEAYFVNTISSTTPYRLLVFQSLCDAVGIALAALVVNKLGRLNGGRWGCCLSLVASVHSLIVFVWFFLVCFFLWVVVLTRWCRPKNFAARIVFGCQYFIGLVDNGHGGSRGLVDVGDHAICTSHCLGGVGASHGGIV